MLSFLGWVVLAAVAFGAWSLRAALTTFGATGEDRPSRDGDAADWSMLPLAGAGLAGLGAADMLDPAEAWEDDVVDEADLDDDDGDFGFDAGFDDGGAYDGGFDA
jgi:hypothetical protein